MTYSPRKWPPGRAEAEWHDLSEHVVHMVKQTDSTPYDSIISILASGRIEARSAFGMAERTAPDLETQKCVCFTEIPPHLLRRIINRRFDESDPSTWHGIAFRKELLVSRNGGPIAYAYEGSPFSRSVRSLMQRAKCSAEPTDDPVWTMTPFIDLVSSTRAFEWEREWRHVGHFDFEPTDVAFLVMPEEFHDAARSFFAEAEAEQTGPSYRCPSVDETDNYVSAGAL